MELHKIKELKKAIRQNFDYILLLDYDSKLSINMVENQMTAYHVLHKQGIDKVGIVAANFYEVYSDVWLYPKTKHSKSKKDIISFNTVISSGSLINLKIFNDVCMFNESLFMYYVDTDFCIRCKNKGWEIYVCSSAILNHRIGNKEMKKKFGITIPCHYYEYIARYYISRNTIYIIKSYCFSNIIVCVKTFLRFMLDLFKIILFEPDKTNKLTAMVKGIHDGLKGRYGKLK